MNAIELATTAYNAYCLSTKGRSLVTGAKLPSWDGLTDPIKAAWIAATLAVCEQLYKDLEENRKTSAAHKN